jgi:hypothetical protein
VAGVGLDEFRSFNRFARHTALGQRGSNKRSGETFAQTGDRITRPQRQLAQESRALAQAFALLKNLFYFPVDAAPHRNGMDQRADHRMVPAAEFPKIISTESQLPASDCVAASTNLLVTPLIAETTTTRSLSRAAARMISSTFWMRGRVAHRGPAKLHDSKRSSSHSSLRIACHTDLTCFPNRRTLRREVLCWRARNRLVQWDPPEKPVSVDREYQTLCFLPIVDAIAHQLRFFPRDVVITRPQERAFWISLSILAGTERSCLSR